MQCCPPILGPGVWLGKVQKRVHLDFAGPLTCRENVPHHHARPLKIAIEWYLQHIDCRTRCDRYGAQFVADECATFVKMNGIKNIKCTPITLCQIRLWGDLRRPSRQRWKLERDMNCRYISNFFNFLLPYCTTFHVTTNRTPSELFTSLTYIMHPIAMDILRPTSDRTTDRRQAQQKTDHRRLVMFNLDPPKLGSPRNKFSKIFGPTLKNLFLL